jgi:hypothetical protein
LLFLKPVIRFIEKGIKTDKNAFQAKWVKSGQAKYIFKANQLSWNRG